MDWSTDPAVTVGLAIAIYCFGFLCGLAIKIGSAVAAHLHGTTDSTEYYSVVFQMTDDGYESIFVEIEDDRQRSVGLGEWIERPNDGYWELRLDARVPLALTERRWGG